MSPTSPSTGRPKNPERAKGPEPVKGPAGGTEHPKGPEPVEGPAGGGAEHPKGPEPVEGRAAGGAEHPKGPEPVEGPTTRAAALTLWAPKPDKITAVAGDHRLEMIKDSDDWWRPAGTLPDGLLDTDFDYGFLLDDDETPLPDPRSRRQPNGVHGLSRTHDPAAHQWQDQQWTGRQLAGGVIYELHLGTFTAEGTLRSAIERLDHLVELGIDFVELLPVNAFNGDHNWGYDGVAWYAVQESYGGPAAYQEFVDACHRRGLAVIQDVVYNHLGPSGNYLPRFLPIFSDKPANTWGESINLDGPDSDGVRRYIIDNALMWLRDYHVDGLRLDAVHALADTRATHLLEELAVEVDALSAHLGRPLSLIAESDLNNPTLITPRAAGGYGLTGQWSDDFHHAVSVAVTGDTSGYFADFASLQSLAKVINSGFFHDGGWSSFRRRSHGRKINTEHTATWQLVVCSANHDQIGNRAAGDRLATRIDRRQLQLAAMITVLAPFTPMIFMGEEWGARTPWQFFSSHPEEELGRIVAEGRVQEFAEMDWDTSVVPDPQDPQTFQRSKLDWSEPTAGEHAEILDTYRELIRLRRRFPQLVDPRFDQRTATADDATRTLRVEADDLVLMINFGTDQQALPTGVVELIFTIGDVERTDDGVELGQHSALLGRMTGSPNPRG